MVIYKNLEDLPPPRSTSGAWIQPGRKWTSEDNMEIYRSELRLGKSICSICRMHKIDTTSEYPRSLKVTSKYGYVVGFPTRCSLHRAPDMELVSAHDKCTVEGCTRFRLAGGIRSTCATHQGGYRCASCSLYTVREDGDKCRGCQTGNEYRHRFEEMVYGYLDTHPDERFRHFSYQDTALPCAPTQRRPDRVYILEDRMVVLEVDEGAHRFYQRDCEVVRILEVHEQGRGLPMMMIRFNPKKHLLERLARMLTRAMICDITEPITLWFLGYKEAETYDIVAELNRLSGRD